MPRHLPPLNALRAFEAAARHNSFTGAASELRVSHAAISRHVRGLEAKLGVTLFLRAKRGVQLTQSGTTYLASVRQAFDLIGDATDRLAKTKYDQLRISVEPAFAARWLVSRLGRWRETYPECQTVLDVSPRLVNLERDESDLAIRYGRGDWPDLHLDLIVRLRLFPVGARSLLHGKRRSDHSAVELARFTLLHDDDGELWRRWFEAAGVVEVDTSRGPRLSETSLALDAAIAGQGIALADQFLVSQELASRRLIRLSDIELTDHAYYLVALQRSLRRKPIVAFRDWLLAEVRSSEAASRLAEGTFAGPIRSEQTRSRR
ncbi:MAG TPA: transcriptional regulator GcvA [Alphaproteobacteria bacterium]|nr:transcriptional regulator GcvA [Alphaproteobacteria bacterium]